MTVQIAKYLVESLPFTLDDAVREFTLDLENHKNSEGLPAPVGHPLVEFIVRSGGVYEVLDEEPFSPPLTVSVSRAQALMALYNAGLLEAVKSEVSTHPYEPIRIWYENAGQWERNNPYVLGIALELGLSDEQVDALFLAASKLG